MSIRDYMENANLKFNGALKERTATNGIVIHHAAAATATPQQIHEWHQKRGWLGAGYNVYVHKDGSVWELRPLWAVGAHAEGVNFETIGVCAEGMYHPSDSQPYDSDMPQAQFNSLIKVIKDLMREYPSIKWIKGHSEVPGSMTVCPGRYFPLKVIIQTATDNGSIEEVYMMKRGDRGPMVEKLQKILIDLGYPLPKYGADGIFGVETENAVNAFKKSAGLPQDGMVDIFTMISMADRLFGQKSALQKENITLTNRVEELAKELKKVIEVSTTAEKRILEAEGRNKKFVEFFRLLNSLAKEVGE